MAQDNSGEDSSKAAKSKKPSYQRLEDLGFAQCSLEEAALILGRAHYTKPFGVNALKAYHKGRAAGLNELRKAQLGMAKKSVALATRLGRLYLGQDQEREPDGSGQIDYAAVAERHAKKFLVRTDPGRTEGD